MPIEPTAAERETMLEFLATVGEAYKSDDIGLEEFLEVLSGAFSAALADDRDVFAYMGDMIQQDDDQIAREPAAANDDGGERNVLHLYRYDIQQHEDGTWLVHDRTTGHPAVIDGHAMVGMDIHDADHACDVLNAIQQGAAPGAAT